MTAFLGVQPGLSGIDWFLVFGTAGTVGRKIGGDRVLPWAAIIASDFREFLSRALNDRCGILNVEPMPKALLRCTSQHRWALHPCTWTRNSSVVSSRKGRMGALDYLNLNDVLRDIAVCPYDVRLALVNGSPGPTVRYLVARRRDQPDQDTPPWNRYEYGQVLFLRGDISGDELSSWLQQKEGCLNDTLFKLPINDQVSINHLPSNLSYGCITLDVPSLRYTMSLTAQDEADRRRPLIAEACPYFPNFQAAVLDLLYQYTDSDTASPEPVIIVWPHRDAYFSAISVQPLAMIIQVEGTLHTPVTLHVYGRQPSLHHMEQVSIFGRYEVPFLNGVPKEVHAVLSRGSSLLDLKFIHSSLDGVEDLQDPSSLQALIAQGESVKLEFKKESPERHDKWVKTVVAFANRDGGVLIFGVDPETGHPVGVPEDVNQFETNVSNQISTRINPGINAEVHTVQVQGTALVVVRVPSGPKKPYSLVTKNKETGVSRKYYYRMGSTSFEADPEHIRLAVLEQADRGTPGVVYI